MYQSVLTNHTRSKQDLLTLYRTKLNIIGDSILNNQRFGMLNKVNRIKFIQLKNLIPVIASDILTIPINKLYTALINE